MEIIKSIILGIIQGITEPLPISSSGHINIFKELFNTNMFEKDLNFEIFTNFASFLAILIIFRKDILNLIKGFFKYISGNKNKEYKNIFKYCLLLIISTIPTGLAGIFFKDFIENKLGNMNILAFAFMFTSLMLFIIRDIKGEKGDYEITYKDALIIGLFQMITIIPGISRSGTVLVACLLCNIKRESSLKYTFLLYFPVSVGTLLLQIVDSNIDTNLLLNYSLGMIFSFIFTYISYNFLSSIVKKGKLIYFSLYCLLIALFIFIYF